MVVIDFKETKLSSLKTPPMTTNTIWPIHYECVVGKIPGHFGDWIFLCLGFLPIVLFCFVLTLK
jgi:hypothetical protein